MRSFSDLQCMSMLTPPIACRCHSFSSQHDLPSPSDTVPAAAALPGVSVPHRLQGAQQPGGTAAAGASDVTDKAQHAVQDSHRLIRPPTSDAATATAKAPAAAAAAAAAPPPAGLQAGRSRVNWRLNHSIEWTPKLAEDAHHFWREQGVTRLSQLNRLARYVMLAMLVDFLAVSVGYKGWCDDVVLMSHSAPLPGSIKTGAGRVTSPGTCACRCACGRSCGHARISPPSDAPRP